MPKIAYVNQRLGKESLDIIDTANTILEAYAAKGYQLTLRGVYYQFVSRDLIPNTQRSYSRLGDIIAKGRMNGLLDWDHIKDRGRKLEKNSHWESPESIVDICARTFAYDKWEDQPFRPEVWIEKDALVGIISDTCEELDISYFACRGYSSVTAMWEASERLKKYIKAGQTPLILHFGDHDPSGIDMTRDIKDRLSVFMGRIKVDRLALNFSHIETYSPPPNPAKVQDPRADAYIAEFGDESWELDALEPEVLNDLIHGAVIEVRDQELWDDAIEKEVEAQRLLGEISGNWDEITESL